MKFLYKGDKPVDIKVVRNNGAHTDTVTIQPSPNPYETADCELVAAALAHPELFEPVDVPEPITKETLDEASELAKDKGKKKKSEDE